MAGESSSCLDGPHEETSKGQLEGRGSGGPCSTGRCKSTSNMVGPVFSLNKIRNYRMV